MPKDTHSTLSAEAELVLPERVTLALAVGAGLGMLGAFGRRYRAPGRPQGPPQPAAGRRSSRHPARAGHSRRSPGLS